MSAKWMRGLAGLAAVVFLAGGVATVDAQSTRSKKTAECPPAKANAPERLEGQVIAVDQNDGKVTIRGADGQTHEFRGNKDTVREYKVGDRLELNLRTGQNC